MKLKQIGLWAGLHIAINGKDHYLVSAIKQEDGLVEVWLDDRPSVLCDIKDVEEWEVV